MKKIMLIIISVVILFSSCTKSSPKQIDPSEEFDGIMFGMTQEEISNALSQEDGADYDEIENLIVSNNKTFFNVSNASIFYSFDDYGKLYYLVVNYFDSKHPSDDYAVIKETVLKNYPPQTYNPREYDYGEDDVLDYNTENRSIFLRLLDGNISLHIKDTEQTVPNQDDNDET